MFLEQNLCLANCESCPLKNSKKVSSLILDDSGVDVCIVGQSPGYEEVQQGRPFCGRSGDLINKILQQYTKKIAYINVLSCRPLDTVTNKDRPPSAMEVKCCRARLDSDIDYVLTKFLPKITLVLGVIAKKEIQRLVKSKKFPNINFSEVNSGV